MEKLLESQNNKNDLQVLETELLKEGVELFSSIKFEFEKSECTGCGVDYDSLVLTDFEIFKINFKFDEYTYKLFNMIKNIYKYDKH